MQWYEDNEQYTESVAVPKQFEYEHLSLIRVYPDGKTQPGWGAKEFVENMERGAFRPERALDFYGRYNQPFAFVMRSIPLVCIDIDGKNGGFKSASLMSLPKTLAERSKSGNGYHLYYRMVYTSWTGGRGYDEFPDLIGLVPGVDIKGTGAVYHFPNQMWNTEDIALLPPQLGELIGRVRDVKWSARITKEGTQNMDPDELVIVHDKLRDALAEKFMEGNRNNKIYAIGAQMYATGYPAWETALYDRGVEIGLELREVTEIIRNITQYA